MAAMTLAEARTRVLQYLDDPNNRRWSTAEVDAALKFALSYCLTTYATAGGRRFVVEHSVTTSASTGQVSLTSQLPMNVLGVVVVEANITTRIKPIRRRDRDVKDLVARSLIVEVMTEYDLSATSGHPLVGVGATAANTWPAFDEWVCVAAAKNCGVKDNDKRPGLIMLEQEQARAVLGRVDPPRAVEWPKETGPWLRWSYQSPTSVLTLTQCWSGWAS